MPPGSYDIFARMKDYETATATGLVVPANSTVTYDFGLIPKQSCSTRADYDHDHRISVSDLQKLLAYWGTHLEDNPDVGLFDLYPDGIVDGQDARILITEWRDICNDDSR